MREGKPGIVVFLTLIFTLFVAKAYAQPQYIDVKGNEIICYGSNTVNKVYIPPPKSFTEAKGAGGAVIEVVYTGFPQAPKDAFEYAVAIWSSLLKSNVKIRIDALWTTMSESNVLGSTSSNGYYKGSLIGALNPDAYYAVSVAEKIADKNLNDDADFEINIKFNSASAWYYGIDGSTPFDKYDFVTVVLHELCHGLGFADSFNTTSTVGSYGLSGIPVIYDTYVEDGGTRKRLTNTANYGNPSAELRTALLSNSLNFAGPVTVLYNFDTRPGLYAPGTWNSGSSISHLNETTTSQINALMTPFVAKAEAIHDPGLLTLSMLADIGWIHSTISHTPLNDTEENITEVGISFSMSSDTLLKKNSIKLFYSQNGSPTFDSISVSSSVNGGTFEYAMPINEYNTRINYYISAADTFGRVYSNPATGKNSPNSFFVGTDIIKPVITHQPLKFILSELDTLAVLAEITDNLPSVNAYLEYRLNNGTVTTVPMTLLENDTFYANILPGQFTYTVNDTIHYRIIATDAANSPNTSLSPVSGFYKLPVFTLYSPVEYYFNSFKVGDTDFLMDGFYVTRPTGFDNYALHSKHPYESSELADKTINYYAILRQPISIDSSGIYMTFREIVLVEPGEAGAPFGSDDFFDFVVVEVSKNGGRSWRAIIDGYDSRADSYWETIYNNAIFDQNSTAVGKQEFYRQRYISVDTTTFIDAGDNLLIRFRLFSDPFAHGWGWAIDELFIKAITSSSEKTLATPAKIWPNPGNGLFTVDLGSHQANGITSIKISDFNGRIVRSIPDVRDATVQIDISHQPSGIYYIIINSGGSVSSVKYLLIKN